MKIILSIIFALFIGFTVADHEIEHLSPTEQLAEVQECFIDHTSSNLRNFCKLDLAEALELSFFDGCTEKVCDALQLCPVCADKYYEFRKRIDPYFFDCHCDNGAPVSSTSTNVVSSRFRGGPRKQ